MNVTSLDISLEKPDIDYNQFRQNQILEIVFWLQNLYFPLCQNIFLTWSDYIVDPCMIKTKYIIAIL